MAELLRYWLSIDMNGSLSDGTIAIPNEHLQIVAVLFQLLEEHHQIDHVLVIADGVMRKITCVVIGADQCDEFVEKVFIP